MEQRPDLEPAAPAVPGGLTSAAFGIAVGATIPSGSIGPADLLIDPTRYPSEGDWAFCRFDDPRIPAVRLGFQRGGFNVWPDARPTDPGLLQLHVEVVTGEGAHVWLPAGAYRADAVWTDAGVKDVRIGSGDREVMRIAGWPRMTWWARTDDDTLEVQLEVDVRSVTVLPDALLPHALFAMWESVGSATGWVRVGGTTVPVHGRAFYDHTRVLDRPHAVAARQRYVYTTLALDDGSAIFGYDAIDSTGRPIDGYCFGIHVDSAGTGTFLPAADPLDLVLDADRLPARYRLAWRGAELAVEADVRVRPLPLLRAWGSPGAPRSRAAYPILPLVLDAEVRLTGPDGRRTTRGIGLAEHFDAAAWATQVPG